MKMLNKKYLWANVINRIVQQIRDKKNAHKRKSFLRYRLKVESVPFRTMSTNRLRWWIQVQVESTLTLDACIATVAWSSKNHAMLNLTLESIKDRNHSFVRCAWCFFRMPPIWHNISNWYTNWMTVLFLYIKPIP